VAAFLVGHLFDDVLDFRGHVFERRLQLVFVEISL
jgi:hypothetical protein